MKNWTILPYLASISLLILVTVAGSSSRALFWALYLASVLFLSLHVLRGGRGSLFLIIIFDLFIFSLFAFQYPGFFQIDRDTGFEASYAEEIAALGHWDPHAGNGYAEDYYGYNPLVHFILVFISLSVGVTPHLLAKWGLIIVFRIIFLLLSYRIVTLLTPDRRVALISLLVFAITPRLRVLTVSRRLVAAICIMLAIYALLMSRERKTNAEKHMWLALSVLFSFLVIIADHTLALVYGLFLIGYAIFHFTGLAVLNTKKSKAPLIIAAFFVLSWITWNAVLVPTTLEGDASYASSIIGFFSSVGNGGEGTGSVSDKPYSGFETLLIMAAQGAFFAAAGLAFLWLLLNNKLSWDFPGYWLAVSFPVAALLTYMISTPWVVLANVLIWFFLIPLSYACGALLSRAKGMFGYVIAAVFLLILFSGGILLNFHPHILFGGDNKPFIEAPEYKDVLLYRSAEWLAENSVREGVIIGDRSVFDIYSGFFGFDVVPIDVAEIAFTSNQTELEERFLKREIYFGSYRHTSSSAVPSYIIVNRDLLTHPSYYFTLEEDDLIKFDGSPLLQKIYDNGKIAIYENLYRKSASLGPTVNGDVLPSASS